MPQVQDMRSIADLLRDLGSDASLLVRQELALAKAEIQRNVQQSLQALIIMAAGGFIAFAALIVLLSAVIDGLVAAGFERWLADVIVGSVMAVIGLVLVRSGQAALNATGLAPNRTAANLRRDVDMLKEQVT